MVSGCCKEVYRNPHNNYNFSLLHLHIYVALLLFVHFKNVFFVLVYVILLLKEHTRSFKNRVNANIINYIDN